MEFNGRDFSNHDYNPKISRGMVVLHAYFVTEISQFNSDQYCLGN